MRGISESESVIGNGVVLPIKICMPFTPACRQLKPRLFQKTVEIAMKVFKYLLLALRDEAMEFLFLRQLFQRLRLNSVSKKNITSDQRRGSAKEDDLNRYPQGVIGEM